MLYLVVFPTLKSEDEILWCYHSYETSSVVLLQGTVHLVCSSNFRVWGWTAVVWPFKLNRAILRVFFFNISQREIWPFFRKKKLIVGPCRSKRREGGLGLLPGPDCDSPWMAVTFSSRSSLVSGTRRHWQRNAGSSICRNISLAGGRFSGNWCQQDL